MAAAIWRPGRCVGVVPRGFAEIGAVGSRSALSVPAYERERLDQGTVVEITQRNALPLIECRHRVDTIPGPDALAGGSVWEPQARRLPSLNKSSSGMPTGRGPTRSIRCLDPTEPAR